ncbi:MAG: hypothetical protein ACPG66_01665 [Flavobacteriales bacterium]
MAKWRNPIRFLIAWLTLSTGTASVLFAFPTERDSVVVDGNRIQYLAEVEVDTAKRQATFVGEDWWLGLGWDVAVGAQTSPQPILTSHLPANRPLIYLERQQDLMSGKGRVGAFLAYSQPWAFSALEVSEDAKGWIRSEGPRPSTPLQQVVLTPDSLAFERDTLMAPLASSHAIRLGVMWEGQPRGGWWPRASVSAEVLRPRVWELLEPGDPAGWPAVAATDTFREIRGWANRARFEVGGAMDLGESASMRRAASQFRASLYWVPGGPVGVSVALLASPTRR